MAIRFRPSPNHGPRPAPSRIDLLILHYTGMQTAAAALDRLCDPASEVSAHYLIEEDGAVWQLVDEAHRAWHAGRGFWAGATNINDRSVGIELANPGHEHGYCDFPEAQLASLESHVRPGTFPVATLLCLIMPGWPALRSSVTRRHLLLPWPRNRSRSCRRDPIGFMN